MDQDIAPCIAPYYNNAHMALSHALFPGYFEICLNDQGVPDGRIFRQRFPKLYQEAKNLSFAYSYGKNLAEELENKVLAAFTHADVSEKKEEHQDDLPQPDFIIEDK